MKLSGAYAEIARYQARLYIRMEERHHGIGEVACHAAGRRFLQYARARQSAGDDLEIEC